VGRGIGRLTVPAPLLAWLFGGLAAHYVGGLSWAVAWTLGAILVVTGPTVILPLVRQARLNKDSSSLLKWEGIVNDPVGVLIAVLTFQFFTTPGGLTATPRSAWPSRCWPRRSSAASAAFAIGFAFRRGWVPEHLKPPILMVLVLVVYWASNLVQHEAGLLSVTLMGVVLGNMRLVERESLRHFKENLTVVLLSVLFIVIPAQLGPEHLQLLDVRAVAFVAAVLLVVRPLAIGLATIGAPMRRGDKVLLGWIAPRGIVAAATARIFGPALVDAGFTDAERLLPIAFLIILATVVAHGLTIGPLTRRLGLAAASANGLLIVGANAWTHDLARTLRTRRRRARRRRRLRAPAALRCDAGIATLLRGGPVRGGRARARDAPPQPSPLRHRQRLLQRPRGRAWGAAFGHHRTFQLALHQEPSEPSRRLTPQQRGQVAFDASATLESLLARLDEGWRIETARIGGGDDLQALTARWGEPDRGWQLIGGRSPGGEFRLDEADRPLAIGTGWTVLVFAPSAVAGDPVDDRPATLTAAGHRG
jgi:NhaP-type Na+/H+ or K+/H+ antiporter